MNDFSKVMQNYIKVLQNYAGFDGRASRTEFWHFVLFHVIVLIGLKLIGSITGMRFLYNIYTLAVTIPYIAVGIRRMHDIGKSGWYIIIPFYNIYLSIGESVKGANQYGEEPVE